MPNTTWSQDNFTKGELSPYMYARATINQYYAGLKTAQNVLCYPQGAAGKRFGSYYRAFLESAITSKDQIFFKTLEYLNECTYQIVIRPDNIDIYLEGILTFTVLTTGIVEADIESIDYTILNAAFRITLQGSAPKDLKRTASTPNVILTTAANKFNLTVAVAAYDGTVLPARFTTTGALPTTTPQIKEDVTYFVKYTSSSDVKVYKTSQDAFNDENEFTLTNVGTGTNSVVPQNTWTLAAVAFKNLPIYDFDGGYDAITFTPSATSGAAITITASAAIFTTAHVGGAYIANGGVARITGFTSTTVVTAAVEQAFDSTAAISGALSLLAEPAWSDARGWPEKCSSYQNRALFANTASLPNGFWASAINDYADFNDLESDDDDAISWFPTSDDINYIRFIVPYRSVTVHTNSGVFSSPLSFETAITPKNFSLQLQDSTPATNIQPRAIDNQIIVISGNDVHNLLWDGLNNAYTSDIVSVMSEQVIRNPVNETAFVDLNRAGSRYIFIINENGSMATYQTLISQDVKGWTINISEQSYGNAYYRQAASNSNGRCWFIMEREIPSADTPVAISGYSANSLTATATSFATDAATAVKFTTTGTLPASTPQIATDTYYWVIGVDANEFKVYLTQADALADEDAIAFTDAGTNSNVEPWTLKTKFTLEELTFDTRLDCATKYTGSATDTVTGQSRFNAQSVKMVGDGFGFEATGIDDEIVFSAHGTNVEVQEAYIGFPINLIIEPMPLSMPYGSSTRTTSLAQPKHIRNARFMFNNTIGGTINGVDIALNSFANVGIGEPPQPARGMFVMSVAKGWDDFNNPTFTIEHDEPFNIELLGIFYSVDF